MQIYSLLQDGTDIITQCLKIIESQKLTRLSKSQVIPKCLSKIQGGFKFFVESGCRPDGYFWKSLEGNVLEMRLALPQSKYLLRLICSYEQNELMLLSGYILKPESYDDRHMTDKINIQYRQHINKSIQYKADFFGPQKFDYVQLTEYILDI